MAVDNEGLAKKKILPLETRKKMYHRVLELRRLGYSYSRILEALKEECSATVSKLTISDWVRNVHNPYREGLGDPDEDQRLHRIFNPYLGLAYVIGAVLGDGYVMLRRRRKERKCEYMNILAVNDYEFAEDFGKWAR